MAKFSKFKSKSPASMAEKRLQGDKSGDDISMKPRLPNHGSEELPIVRPVVTQGLPQLASLADCVTEGAHAQR